MVALVDSLNDFHCQMRKDFIIQMLGSVSSAKLHVTATQHVCTVVVDVAVAVVLLLSLLHTPNLAFLSYCLNH